MLFVLYCVKLCVFVCFDEKLKSLFLGSRRIILGDQSFIVPHKTHSCDCFSALAAVIILSVGF